MSASETLLPAPGEPDACYLVDLPSWARAIHQATRGSSDRNVVVRSVVGRLVNLLVEQEPAYLGVAVDTPGPTWHRAIWADYKAKRVAPGPAYDAEIELVVRALAAHRIPVFRADGFEADDLLATAARRARRAGLRVVVVSRDHDLWQLCDEAGELIVWDGAADTAIGAPEVRRRYGVGPSQLGDLMALAGDGDEAPGIDGIGEKTAAELLQKRGSLAEVLRKWSWEQGARAARLREGAEAARMSRRLVTLREDAPIAFDLAELAVGWDREDAEAIRQLGEELEVPRMCQVRSMPKARPSAEMVAATAAIAEAPVEEPCAAPEPVAAEPAGEAAPEGATTTAAGEGGPKQGTLFGVP